MSSLPANMFNKVDDLKGRNERKASFISELKLLAASIRAAWQPKSEQEPVDSFMRY